MKKKIKSVFIIPIIIVFLWGSAILTDYILSTKDMPPVFAWEIEVSDANAYQGIGYRIVLDDGFAVSPPDAEIKGYFYWGW